MAMEINNSKNLRQHILPVLVFALGILGLCLFAIQHLGGTSTPGLTSLIDQKPSPQHVNLNQVGRTAQETLQQN
jgi:hypothetical protein